MLPNKEFLIVGESGINISDYIKLEPNVKVIGVQNKFQIKSLYQKSKFYFQGSRLEGLPNSLCEAMLCGCVPIGSQVFGFISLERSSGFMVYNITNPNNPEYVMYHPGAPGDIAPESIEFISINTF